MTNTKLLVANVEPETLKELRDSDDTGLHFEAEVIKRVRAKAWSAAFTVWLYLLSTENSCSFTINAGVKKASKSTPRKVVVSAEPGPDCVAALGEPEEVIKTKVEKCLLDFVNST